MQFRGVLGLFLTVLSVQIANNSTAYASEINGGLESTFLKSGYAIRLLKPLPRRNSGCDTIFRGGEVLESCEPNYGLDPAVEGVVRNYCEWNLNTHYQKNNSAKWLESYFNPDLISITDAKVGFSRHDEKRTLLQRARGVERVVYRWIEIDFNDQITGSKLGSLKCYPSQAYEYVPGKKKLFGEYYYHEDQSPEENARAIKSGLTIQNVLDQLAGYVELVQIK